MARSSLVLILLVVFVVGCSGYKPRMTPDNPELLINEGDELVINCTSRSPFKIIFPETSIDKHINTSVHDIFHIEDEYWPGTVKRMFQRINTVHGDTGWYGCVDERFNETDEGDFNDPNASWVYVYVKSNESLFASENEELMILFAYAGDTLVLPCRPTSPALPVSLTFNFQPVELGESVSFDPKKGFTMKRMKAIDSGMYTCTIDRGIEGEDPVEMEAHVTIYEKRKKLVDPLIITDNLRHVTKGSELNVTCTAEVGIAPHQVSWITPNDKTVRKIYTLPPRRIDESTKLVTSVLNIPNVTYDDEGEYTCKLQSQTMTTKTSHYIEIFDPSQRHINLTSHDPHRKYQVREGDSAIFSATVEGYPRPTVIWVKYDPRNAPKEKIITSEPGIVVKTAETGVSLRIESVHPQNAGLYIVQAFHNDSLGGEMQSLNFSLEVLAKPATMLSDDDNVAFFSVNEAANFSCRAFNNPPANISMFYHKCPEYPITTDCESVQLVSKTVIDTQTEKVVRVQFNAEQNGMVNCTACNFLGCDSAELSLQLTDGIPNQLLGIKSEPELVTANDEVTLTCMAPIYNVSKVEWQGANYEPIRNTDRIQVSYINTTYTRRAILTIKDVHKSDEGDYVCMSLTHDNSTGETLVNKLEVYDPVEPAIKITNMNGSEVELTVDEAHNIRLYCYAEGMPYPKIAWYKNDQPLESDGLQFTITENNRELTINYLMEQDSGEYSCVAKNRVNQARVYQKYIIKGPEISKTWIIAGVAIVVTLLVLSIYFCISMRREKRMRKQLIEVGLMHFEEGALDCINPDLTVDDQAELLPYDRKWEFPRDKLKLGKQLGSGAFGVVMKAEARGILADEPLTTVAVKMVHRNAEPAYIRALASELKIMVHLGKHLNVVNLLGACTNNIAKRELLVIVEYCRYGNLHNYLLRHREDFINQIDPETGKIDPFIGSELLMRSTSAGSNNRLKYAALSFSRSLSSGTSDGRSPPGTETVIYTTETQELAGLPNAAYTTNGSQQPGWRSNYRGDYKDRNLKPICTQDLLSWAFQVARGMEYLSQRKVLHGDLAARNILLAENNVVKICDFGLAKTMYKDANYQKKGDGPVPIKWMAVESIRDRVFSTQSDVWSFGVVLWEFFTLAETPYPGMKAETQYLRLVEGYRMEQPKHATKDIYDIMLQCWRAKPALRPSFSELVGDIGELLEEGVRKHYVDLNSLYIDTIDDKRDYLQMMSAPDHAAIAGPRVHDYVNCPQVPPDAMYLSMNSPDDGSVIFSPRPNSQENTRFQFPSPVAAKIANANNSDGEDSPMLKKLKEEPELDEDNYLKPIDVQKKREEFTRKREAERRKSEERSARVSTDRDSGYCNTPKALELIDVKIETPNYRNLDDIDAPTMILKSPDEKYSWRQKNEPRKPAESFMNPSYVFVESNQRPNQDTL